MNGDSLESEILAEALKVSTDVEGLTLEIGARCGGSTLVFLDHHATTREGKSHIAIDPFGGIPYHYLNVCMKTGIYTNSIRDMFVIELFNKCKEHELNAVYFQLEDTEFFKRFPDGVPIYENNKKTVVSKYSCVFIDGQHTLVSVQNAFEFFKDRISQGGTIVFDDIDQYPHMEEFHSIVLDEGFKTLTQGERKISYVKEK